MRGEEFLYKLELADPKFVMAADATPNITRHGGGWRRALTIVAAAALLTVVCLTAAMALSVKVRQFVFDFFTGEKQTIPESPVDSEIDKDSMFVEPKIIIGELEERTFHLPVSSHAGEGTFLVCTDPVEWQRGSHYDAYREEHGELIKLPEYELRKTATLGGVEYDLTCDWAPNGEGCAMTWDGGLDLGDKLAFPVFGGRAERRLVALYRRSSPESGRKYPKEYPVIINMYTGEITDVLVGTGAEDLTGIYSYVLSEDERYMLMEAQEGEEFGYYVADIENKELYSLNELSGERVDGCALLDESIACWSEENRFRRGWSLSLDDYERTETFGPTKCFNPDEPEKGGMTWIPGIGGIVQAGITYHGCRFALDIAPDRSVTAIDLSNGERLPIEGFRWREYPDDGSYGIGLYASPDGKKLLLAGHYDGRSNDYLAIIDFEKRAMVEIERENSNDYNEYVGWFDNDTVVIEQLHRVGDGIDWDSRDFFLYSLADKEE